MNSISFNSTAVEPLPALRADGRTPAELAADIARCRAVIERAVADGVTVGETEKRIGGCEA